MTKFLLGRSADPNSLSEHNETPLHLTLRGTLHGTKYEDNWTDLHWRVEHLWDLLQWEEEIGDTIFTTIEKNREDVLNALLTGPRTSMTVKDCEHEHALHCVK